VGHVAFGDGKPDVQEILKKVQDRKIPANSTGLVTMVIKNGDSISEKVFSIKNLRMGEGQSFSLVEFKKPGKTKILAHLKDSGEDERWIKTSSGRAKRISSSGGDQSFAQSHFTYDDLQFANSKDYNTELVCEGSANCEFEFSGSPHYKIKYIPKKQDSAYSHLIGYIRVSDYYPTKLEYFGRSNDLLRVMTVDSTKEMAGGYLMPEQITMQMKDPGEKTTMRFSDTVLDAPSIKRQDFDQNNF
jgi:hypothetical protein